MANEYGTEPILRAAIINEFAHDRDSGAPRRNPYRKPPEPAEVEHPVEDVAMVLGLPADQIGPAVLAAVSRLLSEIERLRWQKSLDDHRIEELQHLADRHSVVPCLNRRGFVRAVETYLTTAGGGVVAVLHVARVELLRMVHGQMAGEGALRHVCASILKLLRETDLVGCIGGSDFGLLMPACTPMDARVKLARICTAINNPGYRWMERTETLVTTCGFHVIAAHDSAENAIAAADRNRCAGGMPPTE